MAQTPEGRIKKKVSALLQSVQGCYYHMPVQNGMGRPTLDYIGCCGGRFFAIETKAPGKKPTTRQLTTIADMAAAGATVFVIDSEDLQELHAWLLMCFE
jgi:hypothetical protein